MKTKDLLSITLKIIGLFAFWKAIQALVVIFSEIGIFSFLFSDNQQPNTFYMISVALQIMLSFLLPLIVGILFLFRTEKVLSTTTFEEHDKIVFNLNKLVIYHLIVIVFGLLAVIHGAGNLLELISKTDTQTEYVQSADSAHNHSEFPPSKEKVVVTNSIKTTFNIFALIEILLGIILLAKATDFAKKIEKNFDSKTTIAREETNN
jgi:hypothetical protein